MTSSIEEILEAFKKAGIDISKDVKFETIPIKDDFKPIYDKLCSTHECMSVHEREQGNYQEVKDPDQALIEAKETGKDIRYGDVGLLSCKDDDEDCSWDVVDLYVTPEGKYLAKRRHMY